MNAMQKDVRYLKAQPVDPELTAKLLGRGVAVSPIVTVEPRRRKFHKAITLSMPAPKAQSQGMINQYSGNTPTLRLLCSITGGASRAQWEDVTGSTPLTFVNDCVSFTTTVSARFWLMDCRNISEATKMATDLYREVIHVPFMAKFVVFAKRLETNEANLRVFCVTDDKEDKTLEKQEQFKEVAKSRDVEVLEGKQQFIEMAGNLVPITKSGEQLQLMFKAFRENRLSFSVRVKDQHADIVGRTLFMKEPKIAKGEPPQHPICILNIILPEITVSERFANNPDIYETESSVYSNSHFVGDLRIADLSNLLGKDYIQLAPEIGISNLEVEVIKSRHPKSIARQAQELIRLFKEKPHYDVNILEYALKTIGRDDIIKKCRHVKIHSNREENLHFTDNEKSLDKQRIHDKEESKYSVEEKEIEESESEDENQKKTVAERREKIVKRLSVERQIPASSQKKEIVQEITEIKRTSLIDDKKAIHEEEIMLQMPTDNVIKYSTPDCVVKMKLSKLEIMETSKLEFEKEPVSKVKTALERYDKDDSDVNLKIISNMETVNKTDKYNANETLRKSLRMESIETKPDADCLKENTSSLTTVSPTQKTKINIESTNIFQKRHETPADVRDLNINTSSYKSIKSTNSKTLIEENVVVNDKYTDISTFIENENKRSENDEQNRLEITALKDADMDVKTTFKNSSPQENFIAAILSKGDWAMNYNTNFSKKRIYHPRFEVLQTDELVQNLAYDYKLNNETNENNRTVTNVMKKARNMEKSKSSINKKSPKNETGVFCGDLNFVTKAVQKIEASYAIPFATKSRKIEAELDLKEIENQILTNNDTNASRPVEKSAIIDDKNLPESLENIGEEVFEIFCLKRKEAVLSETKINCSELVHLNSQSKPRNAVEVCKAFPKKEDDTQKLIFPIKTQALEINEYFKTVEALNKNSLNVRKIEPLYKTSVLNDTMSVATHFFQFTSIKRENAVDYQTFPVLDFNCSENTSFSQLINLENEEDNILESDKSCPARAKKLQFKNEKIRKIRDNKSDIIMKRSTHMTKFTPKISTALKPVVQEHIQPLIIFNDSSSKTCINLKASDLRNKVPIKLNSSQLIQRIPTVQKTHSGYQSHEEASNISNTNKDDDKKKDETFPETKNIGNKYHQTIETHIENGLLDESQRCINVTGVQINPVMLNLNTSLEKASLGNYKMSEIPTISITKEDEDSYDNDNLSNVDFDVTVCSDAFTDLEELGSNDEEEFGKHFLMNNNIRRESRYLNATDIEDYNDSSSDEETSKKFPVLKLSLQEFLNQGITEERTSNNRFDGTCKMMAGSFLGFENYNKTEECPTDNDAYSVSSDENYEDKSACIDFSLLHLDSKNVENHIDHVEQSDEELSKSENIGYFNEKKGYCVSEDEIVEMSGCEEEIFVASKSSNEEIVQTNFPCIDIKFTSGRKKKNTAFTPSKTQFLQISANFEESLTDIEKLELSAAEDSVDEDSAPMARAVVIDTTENSNTDVEDLFSIEQLKQSEETESLNPQYLPPPHREMVLIREDKNGDPITNVVAMDSDFHFGLPDIGNDDLLTDIEDISSNVDDFNDFSTKELSEVGSTFENEVVHSSENVKTSISKRNEYLDNLTDTEEIFMSGSVRRKKNKSKTQNKSKSKQAKDNIDYLESKIFLSSNALHGMRNKENPVEIESIKNEAHCSSMSNTAEIYNNESFSVVHEKCVNMFNVHKEKPYIKGLNESSDTHTDVEYVEEEQVNYDQ